MNQQEQAVALHQLLSNSAANRDLRSKLLRDPAAVLGAAGFGVAPGVKLVVAEDSDAVVHLVIRAPATDGDLSDAQLGKVAGAGVPKHYNS